MPPKKKISEEVTTIDGADSAASPAKKVRKSKKTTAGAGAADEEENSDSAKAEKAIKAPKATASPAKKARKSKKTTAGAGAADEEENSDSAKAEKAIKAPKAKVVQADYMPKTYAPEDYASAPEGALKIVSYNVNGLNACVEKGFKEYIAAEDADILVIQETKLQQDKTEKFDEILASMGYPHRFWSCSTAKKGYSGTAVFSKIEPLNVHYGLGASGAHNEEGRTITCEFDSFYLVNSYVPNSGMKLERLDWREQTWDAEMLKHIQLCESEGLGAKSGAEKKDIKSFFGAVSSAPTSASSVSSGGGKPTILSGDLNVAHEEIDLKNVKTNKNKSPGFCDQERQGMSNILSSGFDDSYRRLYPDVEEYTYFGMRFNSYASNSGWRIDYFIASQALRERVKDVVTRRQVYGASDHCPISLILSKE